LLKGVKSVYPNLCTHHFDDLGIPSIDEMTAQFGDPALWQTYNTRRWIEHVRNIESANLVVLDGQARPKVILDAAKESGFSAMHVTLIDCAHDERRHRLLNNRSQPELDNLDIYAWAAYLRGQADALNLEVIDTTGVSLEKSTLELANSIKLFANANSISMD
jgi:hypothetical protein